MPRIQQVSRPDLHPAAEIVFQLIFGDRDPTVEPGTDTGSPGDWWPTFALVPEVFDHAVAGLALYRSPERKLDPQLRDCLLYTSPSPRDATLSRIPCSG